MAVNFHPSITELKVSDIKVSDGRLRPVADAAVDALIGLIEEYGFTTPILVRKTRNGFVLLDGAHRLEAMKRLGKVDIPVAACSCTDVDAALMEAGQNLPGGMAPLDDAVFLAAWKRAYIKKHPETARGVAGAVSRWSEEQPTFLSFASMVASRRGVTERQVQRTISVAEALDPSEVAALRGAPHVSVADMGVIAKIAEPSERAAVVQRLATGQAKSAAKALKQVHAEQGEDTPVEDPVEAAFKALDKAWARAPMAARKRFLFERASEVWEAQNKGAALNKPAEADRDAPAPESAAPAFTSRRGAA